MTPSQLPPGLVWYVKVLPSTASKPVGGISQRAINWALVSAFQIVSGA